VHFLGFPVPLLVVGRCFLPSNPATGPATHPGRRKGSQDPDNADGESAAVIGDLVLLLLDAGTFPAPA